MLKTRHDYALPQEQQECEKRAERLEWWTLFFLITIVVVMYLAMGSSQAMRAAWIEDVLSLVPPIVFLIAARIKQRHPTQDFPYGYRRISQLAFLCAAVALTLLGIYIFYNSATSLIRQEHPTIGTMELFGRHVWMGWIMMAALVYSALPPVILGRLKLPLSKKLHEKTLYADADMNKADWMTALAGIVGILGVGMGWWWADSVAAGFIAIDVLTDGVLHVRNAMKDLMDHRPTTVEDEEPDPVVEKVRRQVKALDWVQDADLRMREEGQIYSGEVFIVPLNGECVSVEQLKQAAQLATTQSWQIADVVVTAVSHLEQEIGEG